MVDPSRILNSPALTAASRARIVRVHARIWPILAPFLDHCASADREHANEMLLSCLVLLGMDARLSGSNIEAVSCAVVAELLRGDALTNRERVIDFRAN